MLEVENLSLVMSRKSAHHDGPPTETVHDLETIREKEGYHIVSFTKGTGEDPREWSKGKKWYVRPLSPLGHR